MKENNNETLYGTAKNGKAIHFVILNDNAEYVARCDKRLMIDSIVDPDLQPMPSDITCKKCQRFSKYKKYMIDMETETETHEKTETETETLNDIIKSEHKQQLIPMSEKKKIAAYEISKDDALMIEEILERDIIMLKERTALAYEIEKRMDMVEERMIMAEKRASRAEDRAAKLWVSGYEEEEKNAIDRLHTVGDHFSKAFHEIFEKVTKLANAIEMHDENLLPTLSSEMNEPGKIDGAIFIEDTCESLEKEIGEIPTGEDLTNRINSEEISTDTDENNEQESSSPPDEKEKLTEENYKEFLSQEQKSDNITVKGDKQFKHIACSENEYTIIHIASGQKMFTKVPEKIVETATKYLNNINIHWESKSEPIPKDFIPACATAFKAACSNHGVEIKVGVEPEETKSETKPPRVITRRKKEQNKPRKIRRRQKPNVENKTDNIDKAKSGKRKSIKEYGFRENTVRGHIASMIRDGIHFADLCDEVGKIFNIDQKQVKNRMNSVIRKLTKDGYAVIAIKQKNQEMNFYQIVENNEDEN